MSLISPAAHTRNDQISFSHKLKNVVASLQQVLCNLKPIIFYSMYCPYQLASQHVPPFQFVPCFYLSFQHQLYFKLASSTPDYTNKNPHHDGHVFQLDSISTAQSIPIAKQSSNNFAMCAAVVILHAIFVCTAKYSIASLKFSLALALTLTLNLYQNLI